MIEQHPYNSEGVPYDTRILIVGTAPPSRFSKNSPCSGIRGLDFDFYYGSEDNYMWQYLELISKELNNNGQELFKCDATREQRLSAAKKFLKENKIWMHDVLKAYKRKNAEKNYSSDANVVPNEFENFKSVFDSVKTLKSIAYTSYQAAEWGLKAMEDYKIIQPTERAEFRKKFKNWKNIKIVSNENETTLRQRKEIIERKFNRPIHEVRIYNNAEIDVYVLPSPSGRAWFGLRIIDKIDIYKKVLFKREPSKP